MKISNQIFDQSTIFQHAVLTYMICFAIIRLIILTNNSFKKEDFVKNANPMMHEN
jgi:hypothetical protein